MGKMSGRVALVSGAARGQGEAIARLFAAEGATVVLGDILDDLGEKVAADLGEAARYTHLDVTSERDWAAAVALAETEFGRLDALVNNAGILRLGSLGACTTAEYLACVQVNQVGVFHGMTAAVPALRRAGGGTIVNTSSVSGMTGVPGTVAYTASKFAVRGMTKVAALELGGHGIRVNSVHPGTVATPMVAAPSVDGESVDQDAWLRRLPLGRAAEPAEIARLVLFLSCDDSSYCTGSEFVADGGQLAGQTFGS